MHKYHAKFTPTASIILISLISFTLLGCDFISWQRYYNREYRLSLLLPRRWQKEEGTQNVVILVKAPLSGPNDRVQENVNVVVSELPKEISLVTFFELNKDEIMQNFPGYKHNVSEKEIFSGRTPGMVLSFDNQLKDATLRIISACWRKGNYVYVVTCVYQSEEHRRYEPIFNKILRSLRIK